MLMRCDTPLCRQTAILIRILGAVCLVLMGHTFAEEREPQALSGMLMGKLSSGRAVGEKIPQFYTRAITGPLMNKSVCYVCRNGDRPVVMVFLRQIAPGLPQLLKRLDKHVDEHRADGLRGFAVMISDEDRKATSALQTLAFEQKLSIPLTLSPLHVGLPGNQNIHEEAVVTVVLYRDQQVTHSHAFREADLTPENTEVVLHDIERLLATEPMTQAAR